MLKQTYRDVPRSVQELSVQVGDFNSIVISNVDQAVRATTNTHHGPVLQHLATDGTRSDQEVLQVQYLVVEGITEDGDLSVVTSANQLGVALSQGLGETFDAIEEQELVDGSVFGRDGLDNFLSDDTTEGSSHGRKVTSRGHGEFLDQAFIEFYLLFQLAIKLVDEVQDGLSVFLVPGARQVAVVFLGESVDGLNEQEVLIGSIELGVVSQQVLLEGNLLAPESSQGVLRQ